MQIEIWMIFARSLFTTKSTVLDQSRRAVSHYHYLNGELKIERNSFAENLYTETILSILYWRHIFQRNWKQMPGVVNNYVPTVDEAAAALSRIRQKCGSKAAGLDSLSKLLADPLFKVGPCHLGHSLWNILNRLVLPARPPR